MTLVNLSDTNLELVEVVSPSFGKIEVHEMKTTDGRPRMRRLTQIEIASRDQLELEPGGKHLMMFDAQHALKPHTAVEVTLIFASGAQQKVSLPVLPFEPTVSQANTGAH